MKYVILGTGNISNTYIDAVSGIEGSEVVACISRSGNHPKNAPDLPVFDHPDAVPFEYDAVIVATPNGLHAEGIIQAAERGKHVLVEKPLGIDAHSMQSAVDACEENDVKLAVAYQRRTSTDNMTIKELLSSGVLGKVFAADLSAKFYRDQAYYDSAEYRGGWELDGGGPFIQQACHNIDLYTWFFGLPEKVVSMMDTFTHQIDTEDHGAAILRYSNGMIGTFIASTSTKPGFAARLEVHTERGSFAMTDDVITSWHFDDIPNPANRDFSYKHDGAKSASVSDPSAHRKIIVDLENVVENGGEPIADGKSAMETSELILTIYKERIS